MKEEILRGRILLFMEKNKLSKLKEKFNNKTKAVIVGNGPSISKIDWDKIQNCGARKDILFLQL